MLGANPLVSNGWMVWNPRWKHDLETIAARERVVVVDPRATETASRHEHWPIRPDGDVRLLIGLMRVLFGEGLVDRAAVAAQVVGLEELEAAVTDAIVPGTIAYPHGRGHRVGWMRANDTPGATVNVLPGLGIEWVEFVSGMTLIDCLDVTVTRTEKERV